MNIAVFDTWATRPDGSRMHFDILVPDPPRDVEQVLHFGRRYLAAKGLPADSLSASQCRFCHMEHATGGIEAAIARDGFAVIELSNCH